MVGADEHRERLADIDAPGDVADILGYKPPVWQVILFVADGLIPAGLAVWGFFAIRGALKKGKKPEEGAAE